MVFTRTRSFLSVLLIGSLGTTAFSQIEPDDDLPPDNNPYLGYATMLDGLGAGNTIEGPARLFAPASVVRTSGGTLGGTRQSFTDALQIALFGTGIFSSYSRNVVIPISLMETDSAPRTQGAASQSFDEAVFRLQGQITGDPDFDLLRITGGSDFGLPSPGHTEFTKLGPTSWLTHSFFDITFRIDMIGTSGGPFSGRSGSTTQTVRYELTGVPEPTSLAVLSGLCGMAIVRRRRR